MSLHSHFTLLAGYNQWMNEKLYDAAGRLSAEARIRDRGAFFRSILGTLNHIAVADRIWLKRFAEHPACSGTLAQVAELPDPAGLDQVLYNDLGGLAQHRVWLDGIISDWIHSLAGYDLEFVLSYRNMKGEPFKKQFSSLVLTLFNHQTHHRGQVTTMLNQAGVDVGVTDLLAVIPDETPA